MAADNLAIDNFALDSVTESYVDVRELREQASPDSPPSRPSRVNSAVYTPVDTQYHWVSHTLSCS